VLNSVGSSLKFYNIHLCWFNVFAGGDNEGPWFIPDILVNVHRAGDESVGVIREVLPV